MLFILLAPFRFCLVQRPSLELIMPRINAVAFHIFHMLKYVWLLFSCLRTWKQLLCYLVRQKQRIPNFTLIRLHEDFFSIFSDGTMLSMYRHCFLLKYFEVLTSFFCTVLKIKHYSDAVLID